MPLPLASPTITIQPLKANPELSLHIQDDSESIIEYRVANYRTLKSGRVLNRYGWGWFDITILPVLVASLRLLDLIQWDKWRLGIPLTWNESYPYIWIAVVVYWAYTKCTTTLSQSATPLPNLGLQLSTTSVLSLPFLRIPLTQSHHFIPLTEISTVVIHEYLYRWSVRYYLAVIKKRGQGVVVVFDEVSPAHAVLLEVYHGIREKLFEEYEEVDAG